MTIFPSQGQPPEASCSHENIMTNCKLALATWLVCKAVDLRPAKDKRTMMAFAQVFRAMRADNAARRSRGGT